MAPRAAASSSSPEAPFIARKLPPTLTSGRQYSASIGRAATARAEFPNPGGAMRPGMLMRVAVRQGARTAASAPEAAVQYEGQRAFVFRIARGEQGSTAQRIEIEPGVVENGFVEILSGVETGDRLVGSGLNRIQPGAPVSPVGEGGAPNQGAASRKSAQ